MAGSRPSAGGPNRNCGSAANTLCDCWGCRYRTDVAGRRFDNLTLAHFTVNVHHTRVGMAHELCGSILAKLLPSVLRERMTKLVWIEPSALANRIEPVMRIVALRVR